MTLLTIDLRADAVAEAARLAAARALVRGGDPGSAGDVIALAQLDADAAWIMTARPPALRQALGGRALAIWRVACEDAGGRIVDSRLVAIAIDVFPAGVPPRTRRHIEALASAIEREGVEIVERSSEAWRTEVERTTRAFAAARASRARGLDDDAASGDRRLIQPGLFDCRALRAARPPAGHANATVAAVTIARPRLRLVVVP